MENYPTYTKEDRITFMLNVLKRQPKGFAYLKGISVEWTPDFFKFNIGTDEVKTIKNSQDEVRKILETELK